MKIAKYELEMGYGTILVRMAHYRELEDTDLDIIKYQSSWAEDPLIIGLVISGMGKEGQYVLVRPGRGIDIEIDGTAHLVLDYEKEVLGTLTKVEEIENAE